MQSCVHFVRLRPFVAPILPAVIASTSAAIAQEVPGDFWVFLPVDAAGSEPAGSEFAGRAARPLAEDPLVVRARRVGIGFETLSPLSDVLERGAPYDGMVPAATSHQWCGVSSGRRSQAR